MSFAWIASDYTLPPYTIGDTEYPAPREYQSKSLPYGWSFLITAGGMLFYKGWGSPEINGYSVEDHDFPVTGTIAIYAQIRPMLFVRYHILLDRGFVVEVSTHYDDYSRPPDPEGTQDDGV